mmetsp:Transcript_37831/g.116686  ORF Transcript_37831/g.116686 Transcript_37831/m.116686 type:complete len:274 (+) Transcript_37831:600-1421(+)
MQQHLALRDYPRPLHVCRQCSQWPICWHTRQLQELCPSRPGDGRPRTREVGPLRGPPQHSGLGAAGRGLRRVPRIHGLRGRWGLGLGGADLLFHLPRNIGGTGEGRGANRCPWLLQELGVLEPPHGLAAAQEHQCRRWAELRSNSGTLVFTRLEQIAAALQQGHGLGHRGPCAAGRRRDVGVEQQERPTGGRGGEGRQVVCAQAPRQAGTGEAPPALLLDYCHTKPGQQLVFHTLQGTVQVREEGTDPMGSVRLEPAQLGLLQASKSELEAVL